MNTIHNNGENDQTLNDGLEKLGRAYGQLEQDQPPEMLDQAILNSAHRAVVKKSGWKQFGWMHGLATAAVFVLAFTVILDQRELAPEFKEDVLLNTPSRLNREMELKKQAVDKIGKSTAETESTTEYRQKTIMRDAPVPAAAALEPRSEETAVQSMRIELNEIVVQAAAAEKREQADMDDSMPNELQEAFMLDEADLLSESVSMDAAYMQVAPAIAAPAISAMKTRGRMDLTIEQELLAIIELKLSGDESWADELEAFVERNPDYPLPDELKH